MASPPLDTKPEAETPPQDETPLSQETLDRIAAAEILDGFDVLVRDVAFELMIGDDLEVLREVAKHDDPRMQIWQLRKIDAELFGVPFDLPQPAPETDLNRAYREKERQRIEQIMAGRAAPTPEAGVERIARRPAWELPPEEQEAMRAKPAPAAASVPWTPGSVPTPQPPPPTTTPPGRPRLACWPEGAPQSGAEIVAQPEITPIPCTQEAVAALIETLVPGLSPIVVGSTTDMAIAGLASLRLDMALVEPFLAEIKKRTNAPIGGLRDLFRAKLAAITGPTKPMKAGAVEAMLERYIHVKGINAFWDTQARTVLTINAVCNAHWREMPLTLEENPKPINPFNFLIMGADESDGCRRADRFEFRPEAPEFFDDDRGCRALNIWVKPTLVPFDGKPEDVDIGPLMRHAEYILNGDAVLINHQFDYLAHLVQKPWVKLKNTILIIGQEGVGKTVFAEMMVRILGADNVAFIDSSNLESVFNGYMDGKLLVVVNELVGLDKKAMNRLKAYITDAKMTINRKNIPTYDYNSCANFLLYSNYDDAARISEGDRRFCIEKSKAQPCEPEYYKELNKWFDGGGDAHLLRFLQDRDLSKFNPYAPPPVTAAKLDIIADSRDHLQAYFQEAFDTGDAPFRHDLVSVNQVVLWLGKERDMRVTHMQVTKFLRNINAGWLGQRSIRDKQRAVVWAIRNVAEWGVVGDDDLKTAWRDIGEPELTEEQRKQRLGRI